MTQKQTISEQPDWHTKISDRGAQLYMTPQNNSILTQMENYTPELTSLPGSSNKPDMNYTPSLSVISCGEKVIKSPKEKKIKTKILSSDPIKDEEDIKAAMEYFWNQPQRYTSAKANVRNYFLFVLGVNCGRRIGDMLRLTIKTFLNKDGSLKPIITVFEQKTSKFKRLLLNDDVKKAFLAYLNTIDEFSLDDPIFKSRQGSNESIGESRANQLMQEMDRAIRLYKKGIKVSTHTMRKTAANSLYTSSGNNIRVVQNFLNHANPNITQDYLKIKEEEEFAATQKIHHGIL